MGRISVSSCRCCMLVSCVHTVAMLFFFFFKKKIYFYTNQQKYLQKKKEKTDISNTVRNIVEKQKQKDRQP